MPGSLERGIFNLNQDPAYTVTLDLPHTAGSLMIRNDRVILDLDGNTLTLDSPASGEFNLGTDEFTGESALMVARGWPSDHDVGTLTVTNGVLTTESFLLGGTGSSVGTLIITGVGTIFNQTSSDVSHAIVAYRGDGTLRVEDGAIANLARLRIGRRGGTPTVTVQGTGARMIVSGAVDLQRSPNAKLNVLDGGYFESQGSFLLAEQNLPGAEVTVRNATAKSREIDIGRDRRVGILNIGQGGTYEVTQWIRTGAMTVSTATTDAGGILNVSGTGSRLTTGTSISLGANATADKGSVGDLNVSDGAAVEVGTYLYMGSASNLRIDGGSVEVKGALTANEGATYALTLHTGEFDAPLTQTGAGDEVSLANMTFELRLDSGFTAALDEEFDVLAYAGTLNGEFLGLAEGASLWDEDNLYEFSITYGSGSADAITLTVIPEPGTLVLALGAGLLLVARWRRRA